MRAKVLDFSERQACCMLRIGLSALHRTATPKASSPKLAEALVGQL
ncbi:MAG: hypothetical protein KC592_11830 [Nitrospira sp.]|nr:hypothetical protein [Nitrospira sp.]